MTYTIIFGNWKQHPVFVNLLRANFDLKSFTFHFQEYLANLKWGSFFAYVNLCLVWAGSEIAFWSVAKEYKDRQKSFVKVDHDVHLNIHSTWVPWRRGRRRFQHHTEDQITQPLEQLLLMDLSNAKCKTSWAPKNVLPKVHTAHWVPPLDWIWICNTYWWKGKPHP